MQKFAWPFFYSAIFMVWCSGYLQDKELTTFLQKAQAHLIATANRATRHTAPESFIFLLDNVRDENEAPYTHKGQQVRTILELHNIIVEAGLLTWERSGKKQMPGNFSDICIWALY